MRRLIPALALLVVSACGEPESPDFMESCKAERPARAYFVPTDKSCACVRDRLRAQKFSDKEIGWYGLVLRGSEYSTHGQAYEAQKKIANYVARNHILSSCNQ